MKRIITSVTLASGGAVAAASFAMGVAAANPDATTITVPDPFGVTFVGPAGFTYETSDASEAIAYGHQTVNFDSANFGPAVEQFFANNVTVNGQPISTDNQLIADNLMADIIDKVQPGVGTQQQILLPSIPNTNIDSGVIGIHDFGNGYGYAYIDLVGPGSPALNSDGVPNAIGAFLVTPNGTYDVSEWENGGDYGNLAYQENRLFDLTNPVQDPFGSLEGNPDIAYQTGGVFGNTAYGSQTFDLGSGQIPSFAQQFFTDNVTVDGHAVSATNPFPDADVEAHIIDKVDFTGLSNKFAEQQILLPSIADTNIDHGVIDIQNLGNGYSYDYIDLVESSNGSGLHDVIGEWLVTPMGDFAVMPWQGAESALFGAGAFDPASMFPEVLGLTPTFDFLF